MTTFPAIEAYRAELRALDFVRLDNAGLDELQGGLRHAHFSSAIEDIHPTPELMALFAMFVDERAPPSIFGPFVHRWLRERLSAQKAALAAMRTSGPDLHAPAPFERRMACPPAHPG